jgi:hypothetical protein
MLHFCSYTSFSSHSCHGMHVRLGTGRISLHSKAKLSALPAVGARHTRIFDFRAIVQKLDCRRLKLCSLRLAVLQASALPSHGDFSAS